MSEDEFIEILCVYFKDNGTFYGDSKRKYLKSVFPVGCTHPKEYGRYLNSIRQLPGLIDGHWDGPFMVDAGYPELVLPEKGPTE